MPWFLYEEHEVIDKMTVNLWIFWNDELGHESKTFETHQLFPPIPSDATKPSLALINSVYYILFIYIYYYKLKLV